MVKRIVPAFFVAAIFMTLGTQAIAAGGSLGGGIHYLHNLGDIKDSGYKENSYSLLGSYQFPGSLLKFEADVEYIFDFVGTDKAMWEPSAWILAGGQFYGGAGIGIGYTDGAWQDNAFYAIRGGVELPVGTLGLDLSASYRFQKDEAFKDLTGENLNSLTFAAILRFRI